jgi:membrane protein required for colicin V production
MGEPLSLNWLDLAIVLVIVGSTAISLLRGFGREILSLINFFVAFLIARLFSPQFSGLLINTIEQPMLRSIAAYGILFFMSLVVGGLIMRGVSMLIKFGGLELFDRLLGTVFGFGRGLIIVLVLVGVMNWGGWFVHTSVWQDSSIIPHVLPMEHWSRDLVRTWIFERDMDGLADSLIWQLDALQNQQEIQQKVLDPSRVLDMLGPR